MYTLLIQLLLILKNFIILAFFQFINLSVKIIIIDINNLIFFILQIEQLYNLVSASLIINIYIYINQIIKFKLVINLN